MACKTSFELHHNFPKIAEESGFTFNTHKPRVQINWSKIKLIDIENLIRDRKFSIVEQHINDILDCVLESEFDVRILDEGVLKIFRLSQLAVEYQQFCRHYLDRSVCVLREEVTNMVQELDFTRRSLKEKDEEIKKLKRKPKYSAQTLPYGNENIAAMILRTLNQNRGQLFSTTPQIDTLQYNKCNYCEKVFMNQLYLQSHISRRHPNVPDVPQRDIPDKESTKIENNEKLTDEVAELKSKLKQMEEIIANIGNANNQTTVSVNSQNNNILKDNVNNDHCIIKENKDAEISENEEGHIIVKIEEWKKEENEKYNNELSLLRKQIIDIVNNKATLNEAHAQNEIKMMEQLHITIKEQGAEILSLKQEILKRENNEKEKRKELEKQMEIWINQVEVQSNEYKSLTQKLNDVVKEAKEFRVQANTEKERANKFEELLQLHLNTTSPKNINAIKQTMTEYSDEHKSVKEPKVAKNEQAKPTADVITLKKLQQKAQELLNIGEISTSDISSISEVKNTTKLQRKEVDNSEGTMKKNEPNAKHEFIMSKPNIYSHTSDKVIENKKTNQKQRSKSKSGTKKTSKKENGYVYVPGSPQKIVRAKLMEEVNQRLVSLGVDPLKNRVPRNIFHKQHSNLQGFNLHSGFFQKYPSREKILLSIMSHLEKNTTSTVSIPKTRVSPKKSSKSFNISSVLSNVKTKALSLVKYDETINKRDKNYDDVTKRALALLKTPPGSTNSSPILQHHNSFNSSYKIKNDTLKTKMKSKDKPFRIKANEKSKQSNDTKNSSKDSDSEHDNIQNHKQITKYINTMLISPKREAVIDTDNPNTADKKNIFTVNDKSNQNFKIINGSMSVKQSFFEDKDSSEDIASSTDISPRKFLSEESLDNPKLTKGVLKNASSNLSLNKKKVLFDMDAIQMKSVSASPSQSITEKDGEDNISRAINLVTEDWDISSIENEPAKSTTTKIQISAHTSPKIAELKQTIESQLTRRNPALSSALVGGVDVLAAPMQKATSFGGSNTSLGSSILDDTDSVPVPNQKAFLKPKPAHVKDDSEIEISDLINDEIEIKK